MTFRRANLPALLHFYDDLAKQAPYLNLESIAVQIDRSAGGLLNATLQISSDADYEGGELGQGRNSVAGVG